MMNLYTIAVLFLSNRIFPLGSKFVINAGFGTIMQALSEISFLDKDQIQQSYLQYGDMGALAEYAVFKKAHCFTYSATASNTTYHT